MKRFSFLFLALLSITALRANVINGSCGDNLSWSYNTETHALVITGSGDMWDHDSDQRPWTTVAASISSVTLPNGLTKIGSAAFMHCSSLTSFDIPTTVTEIGYGAFQECNSLTSIIIPDNVVYINGYAFHACYKLASVTLSSKLRTISYGVFAGCDELKQIIIPSSVTEIGYDALKSCNDVYMESSTPANISASTFKSDVVIHVPCDAVSNYKKAQYWQFLSILGNLDYNFSLSSEEGGIAKITNSVCAANTVVIEAFPNAGWKFTGWSDGGKDNPRALLLTADKSVTAQFEYAPNYYQLNLSGIEYVEGDGIEYSSRSSFSGQVVEGAHIYFRAISSCGTFTGWSDGEKDSYRSITISQDTTISANYTGIETYNISITAGEHGHLSNEKTGTITSCESYFDTRAIPDEGYHFVEWSDGYRWSYRNFTISSDLSVYAIFAKGEEGGKMGDNLYWSYDAHSQQMTIYGSGEAWEDYGLDKYFDSHDNLKSIVIEEGMLSLPKNMFNFLLYLEQVDIPSTIKEIGTSAFEDCRSLAQVTFAANSALTSIGNWAFYNCHELSSIAIPEGVTQIGKAAFYGCTYMSNVKLPASIQQIGDNAFALCQKIGRMDVDAVTPPEVETKTFYAVSRQAPVYVPDESYSLYKNHPLWGELNIIGRSQAPTSLDQTNDKMKKCGNEKILRNSQILILRGDKVYTLTGQEVK